MRLLLVSDTHGRLGVINDLAGRVRADAVIHAGDFGFYDDGSYARLSGRELRLLVLHSDLTMEDKVHALALSPDDMAATARERRLAGEFQSYIEGSESFRVPVYAVWGNHEDEHVVERLFRGDLSVGNLHVLHHAVTHRVGSVLLYGLGGNLLPGSRMMQGRPVAGGGGRLWGTLFQYADLVRMMDAGSDSDGLRVLVTHVSPGKEPFVEYIGARTRSHFTISGHMGAPTSHVWNSFAIRGIDESLARLRGGFEAVKSVCLGAAGSMHGRARDAFSLIGLLPGETIHVDRANEVPRWYKEMTHVNLPDARVGYAILDVEGEAARVQTCALVA